MEWQTYRIAILSLTKFSVFLIGKYVVICTLCSIGFASFPILCVAAYIAIQIAIICGADGRQIILKWDKGYAWRALLLWFVVCLAYTAFVYVSRLLLTLLVGFVGSQTSSRLESLTQLEESSFSA